MLVTHPLNPIYDSQSKVLILGTMPSIKSREENFYYAHPKNRFWFILSKVYEEKIDQQKQALETQLKEISAELQSCEQMIDANIKSSFSYSVGG